MRKKIIILLSLITLKAGGAQPELCHIQLMVKNGANSQKQALLNDAFAKAALRVSGQTSVANALELKNQSENDLLKLVKSYAYKFQDDHQIFDVTFDPSSVKKKLLSNGFAVLPDNRPYTVIWLAMLDEDNQPAVLGSDSSAAIKDALEMKSAEFGLPIILPLLDFSDTTAIEAQDVIEVNKGVLEAVSKKYSAQNVVAGKLVFEDNTWNARFTMLNYPDATWTITSDSLDKIADILFNNISVALIQGENPGHPKEVKLQEPASQPKPVSTSPIHKPSHPVAPEAVIEQDISASVVNTAKPVEEDVSLKRESRKVQQLSLHVAGINDLDKYATIISYLKRIDGIRDVEVAELGEDSALFNIESVISMHDLKGVISKDNFLRSGSISSDKDNEMRFILSS